MPTEQPLPDIPPHFAKSLPPGLEKLEAYDAFRLSVEHSHLPLKQISRLMGWSEYFTRRVYGTDKFYPSFEDLPKFCAVTGNMIIIQWLLAKSAFYGMDEEHQAVDCRALLLRVTDIFADAGEVATEARAAVQDNMLKPAELRHIIAALSLVLDDGMGLLADLRSQIEVIRG